MRVCVRTKAEGYNVTANYAPLATLIGFRGEGRAGGIPLMVYHLDLHNCSCPGDHSKRNERADQWGPELNVEGKYRIH